MAADLSGLAANGTLVRCRPGRFATPAKDDAPRGHLSAQGSPAAIPREGTRIRRQLHRDLTSLQPQPQRSSANIAEAVDTQAAQA
jgi:hypothetical protein